MQINSKLAKFVICKKWNCWAFKFSFYSSKCHLKKAVYTFVNLCVDDKPFILHFFFSNMINEINNINLTLTTFIRICHYLWYYAMYLDLQFQKSEVKFLWKPFIVQYISPCYSLLQNAILATHRLIIIVEAFLFLVTWFVRRQFGW